MLGAALVTGLAGTAGAASRSIVNCGGEFESPCGVFEEPFYANGTGFCDASLVATGFNLLPDIPAVRANEWLVLSEVTLQKFRNFVKDGKAIKEEFSNTDYGKFDIDIDVSLDPPDVDISVDIGFLGVFEDLKSLGGIFRTLGEGTGDIVLPTLEGKVIAIPIRQPGLEPPDIKDIVGDVIHDIIKSADPFDPPSGSSVKDKLENAAEKAGQSAIAVVDEMLDIVTGLLEDFQDPPGLCLDLQHRRHDWDAELSILANGEIEFDPPFGPVRGDGHGDISAFRQSWTHWALASQRTLGTKEPINWIQHIDTHNAFNNTSDGFLIPNQRYSLTGQLELGARSIELDPNDILGLSLARTCHSKPDLLDAGCAFTDRLFDNSLKEIRNWLDDHPEEVIILRLENYIANSLLETLLDNRLGDLIYRKGDDDFFFDPSQPWPSIAALKALGRRVLVLGYNNPNGSDLWWPYPAIEESGTGLNAPDSDGEPNPQWICRADFRLTPDPMRDFGAQYELELEDVSLSVLGGTIFHYVDPSIVYHRDGKELSGRDKEFSAFHEFIRLTESRPLLETLPKPPGELEHFLGEKDIAQLASCRVALLSMDFLHAKDETSKDACEASDAKSLFECRSYKAANGTRVAGDDRLRNAVWSWIDGDRGNHGDAGKLSVSDGRWRSAPLSEKHHVACAPAREGDPRSWVDPDGAQWRVTEGQYAWRDSGRACLSEFPGDTGEDFVFGVPRIGWQNQRLLEAADAAGVGGALWLNVNDLAAEGEFIINERPVAVAAVDPGQFLPLSEADVIRFTSAGSHDPEGAALTYSWEFGDDRTGVDPTSTGPAPTHQYGDNGVFLLTLTVDDGSAGADVARINVGVQNVPPVAAIDSVADETGAEIGRDVPAALAGLTIDLAGSFRDVGWLDTHEADIDWGDGTGDGPVATTDNIVSVGSDVSGRTAFQHVFSLLGDKTLVLTIRDDDGGRNAPARGILIADARGAVELLLDRFGPDPAARTLVKRLRNALDKLYKRNLNAALVMLGKVVDEMIALEQDGQGADLGFAKGFAALAAKSEVVAAIATAQAAAKSAHDAAIIATAREHVATGDDRLAAGDHPGALDAYELAGREVLGLQRP